MMDKKEAILKALKKEKKPMSTSKIAVKIGSNHWMAEKYLEILLEEKKVLKIEQLNSTHWDLNKEKKDE